MSVPELPAEIHDLIIDHLFVDSREKGEHNAILKVAQVCKSFARLIIPRLYRNLVVQKNCSTLKALVDKLIRDPKLARTVRTFRTHAYDDYVDDDDFDEEWVEQLGTHTFFNSDESNSKTINLSSGWEVHNCFEDGLIGVILLCCPNLQSMELDELDFIDNHTSGPRVFWSDFFPWQNLDHVRVTRHYDGELARSECYTVDQLFSAAQDAWPPGKVLKSLYIGGIPPQGSSSLQGDYTDALPVKRLEFGNFGFNWYDDGPYWSLVTMYIGGCKGLEDFTIVDIFHYGATSEFWRDAAHDLLSAVRRHRLTLKSINIDLSDDRRSERVDWLSEDAPDEEPTPAGAFTYRDFPNLESLSIPMPLLFGPLFFLKLPNFINSQTGEGDITMDLPRPAFKHQFRATLVENLPPSLKHLTIWYDDAFQAQAVEAAVQRLKEEKAELFPLLETINVLPLYKVSLKSTEAE